MSNALYAHLMSSNAKQEIVDWMVGQRFVRSNDEDAECPDIDASWEIAWGHDSGYGYVTLYACPHNFGWLLELRTGQGSDRQRVGFGTVRSVSELMAIYGVLSSMSFRWKEEK